MQQPPNPFNLTGLSRIRGGAGSRWLRLIPGGSGRVGAAALNASIRGIMARQQQVIMQRENITRNPDLEMGVASLCLLGGGLEEMQFPLLLGLAAMQQLVTAAAGTATIEVDYLAMDLDLDVTTFVNAWPPGFPVVPDANNTVIL